MRVIRGTAVEDVQASGDGVCGKLYPADFRNIFLRKKGKGPPVRRITWSLLVSVFYVEQWPLELLVLANMVWCRSCGDEGERQRFGGKTKGRKGHGGWDRNKKTAA